MQQDAHFILNKRHSLGQQSGTERWGGATSGYSFVTLSSSAGKILAGIKRRAKEMVHRMRPLIFLFHLQPVAADRDRNVQGKNSLCPNAV